MTSRVSDRGQITIDREARKELAIRPGMVAYQRIVNGHLEVIFLPEPHQRSLFGALHREGEAPTIVDSETLESAVADAIAAGPRDYPDDTE